MVYNQNMFFKISDDNFDLMMDWAGGGSCGGGSQCSRIELFLGLFAAAAATWTVATMMAAVTAAWLTTVTAAAWLTTVAATAAWLTAMTATIVTATVVAAVMAAVTATVMATITAAIVTTVMTTITATAFLCRIDFFADTKLRRYGR